MQVPSQTRDDGIPVEHAPLFTFGSIFCLLALSGIGIAGMSARMNANGWLHLYHWSSGYLVEGEFERDLESDFWIWKNGITYRTVYESWKRMSNR